MSLFHVEHLVAGYGPVTVLRGVHLDIAAGEAVMLGVNGAGKTTTLRAISGLIWRRSISSVRWSRYLRLAGRADRACGRGPRSARPRHVQ